MVTSQILLLRHAEQPANEDDLDLSASGRARAAWLAAYLPKQFGRPSAVHAAAPNRFSVRAFVTMRPLSETLGLKLDAAVKATDVEKLAARLLDDEALSGKLAVVCWTHTELPNLARALKVKRGDFPKAWGEDVYNLVYRLSYKDKGAPSVRRFVQPM